jgi:hypothetical protein
MHPLFYIAGACGYIACRPKKKRPPPILPPVARTPTPPRITGIPPTIPPPPQTPVPPPGVLTSPPGGLGLTAAGMQTNPHRRHRRRRLSGLRR